jgi:hypothetical protein
MSTPKKPQSCKVRILGRLWTLIKKQPPHPSYDGLCCYDERKILLGPSGLKSRRLELLSHELLHARFQELDEESVLEAGKLIGRLHKKIRNYGFRMNDDTLSPPLVPAKAAKKRRRPVKSADPSALRSRKVKKPSK